MPDRFPFAENQASLWTPVTHRAIEIDEEGLILGLGSRLVRMNDGGRGLALPADRDRLVALLTVAYGTSISAQGLQSIEAASAHWQRGDKALANLRLVFSGLPRLREPADAYRLHLAEYLLDEGMAPGALMKELGFAPRDERAAERSVTKYSPDQPRVPSGNGAESGRWTLGDGSWLLPPITLGVVSDSAPAGIRVAANGDDLKPGGQVVVPLPDVNPLDPAQLNRLLPPQEEQAIADTLNIISGGSAEEVKELQPHPYQNLPHLETGAVLPPSIGGYKAYSLAGSGRGSARGRPRVVVDQATGTAYYTNTHYQSFYPIVLTPKTKD